MNVSYYVADIGDGQEHLADDLMRNNIFASAIRIALGGKSVFGNRYYTVGYRIVAVLKHYDIVDMVFTLFYCEDKRVTLDTVFPIARHTTRLDNGGGKAEHLGVGLAGNASCNRSIERKDYYQNQDHVKRDAEDF